MTTPTELKVQEEKISELLANPQTRDDRYGTMLKTLKISNIRCLNTELEFAWPVTVIGGVNGSGKTTILQLCSSAFTQAVGGRINRIGNWIRNSLSTESPAIIDPAEVSYTFWDSHPGFPVPYDRTMTRWKYPRRGSPVRHVEFIGIADFAPRIEIKGRIGANQKRLQIKKSDEIDPRIGQSLSKVLGNAYSNPVWHEVGIASGTWSIDMPQITRDGSAYSELHMGAGEQKLIRLIRRLELLPKKSLILLEEPEITLHPDAHRGLAWYLMALSRRQGHQIIIASHSVELFESLPEKARILVIKKGAKTEIVPNAPGLLAARELSGAVRANKIIVLVEDELSKLFLEEILRKHAHQLFTDSAVVNIGDKNTVRTVTISLRSEGVKAFGVRDADVGESAIEGLFSLPGGKAPEVLLLEDANIQLAENMISGIQSAQQKAKAMANSLPDSKMYKKILEVLPVEVSLSREELCKRLVWDWLGRNPDSSKKLSNDLNQIIVGTRSN